MAKSQPRQGIPTQLNEAEFEQFILPHLSKGRRGPPTTLSFHAIFNYILRLLYLGCQWKELPIEKDRYGRPEIHHTSIYRTFRRWQADGSPPRRRVISTITSKSSLARASSAGFRTRSSTGRYTDTTATR
jgi:transposase